jgi:hypothetical protein
MSEPLSEPTLVKEFRDLYTYVAELGQHVNRVYKRLENIEIQLREISDKFNTSTTVNKTDIDDIQEKMLTKTEFDEFVGGLQTKVKEKLPSLPE